MAQLMSDAESLETLARDVRGVENPEFVSMPEQHPGNAAGGIGLGLDLNVAARGNGEGIDRQTRDALVLQEPLGGLLGHFQTESVIGLRHLRFASAFLASISRKSLAISAGQFAHVAVKRVARFGEAGVIHTAEQVISRHLQRISKPPQGIEGRLARARFEMRDRTGRQTGLAGQFALAPLPQFIARDFQAFLKDFGGVRFFTHGDLDMVDLTPFSAAATYICDIYAMANSPMASPRKTPEG